MPEEAVRERPFRPGGRLESWKEVAAYLNRTVRTVQRWEKTEGLPIHRHAHKKLGSIYANPAELETWWQERRLALAPENPHEDTKADPTGRRHRVLLLLTVAVLALAALFLTVLRRPRPDPFRRITVNPVDIHGMIQRASVSPTGRFLAYTKGDERRQGLWLRDLRSGYDAELLPVADQSFKGGLTFSPDEKHVYYLLEDDAGDALFRLPLLGGLPQRIGSRLDSPVAVSPDGSLIAFVREDRARAESVLIRAGLDGSDERRVGSRSLPAYLDYPAWSPDGNRIVVTAADVKHSRTAVVEFRLSDGRERTIVEPRAGLIRQPSWLPDGTGLVMTGYDNELALFQVWYSDARSGRMRRITQDLHHYFSASLLPRASGVMAIQEQELSSLWVAPVADPLQSKQLTAGAHRHSGVAWSAEAPARIFFDRPTASLRQIWQMDADGSNERSLTSSGRNYRPDACRDGRHVVFLSDRSGALGVWRMRPDGSDQQQLVEATGPTHPSCSPDGKWVLYTAIGNGHWPMLWRIPIEGGASELLNDGHADQPVLSPDGKWIAAFYAAPSEAPSVQREPVKIAILPASGGPPHAVFAYRRAIAQRSGLRWTPDGSAIAYVEAHGGSSELWVQPATGGEPRPAGLRANSIYAFDWSQDGRHLCYSEGERKRQLVQISNSP